jgi:hypothetical protein
MHGSFDKSGKDDSYEKLGFGFVALPVLLVITLIGLAIMHPGASSWISQAVEAEFADFDTAPQLAPAQLAPTQLARPSMAIRTVRTN